MNLHKLGLRFSSSVLTTALVFAPLDGALAAPGEGAEAPSDGVAEGEEAQPEGETPEGETPEGETPEGETPEGETAEGETPEGETPEGEVAEGEGEGEGETPEGEAEAETEEPEEVEAETEEPEETEIEAPPPEIGPMKPAEPTWGPKDQYPMNGKGMLITGGIVTGLGAGFIITSLLITRCDFDSALSCKLGDQRELLVPTAVTATGLGLLLIGVGVGNHVRYKRWQNWTPEKTAVVPTMVPGGGGGLAWVGRF